MSALPRTEMVQHDHARFVQKADMRMHTMRLINSVDQTAIGNVIPKRIDDRQMKAGRPLSWASVPLTL
jgi:hypothetical protein